MDFKPSPLPLVEGITPTAEPLKGGKRILVNGLCFNHLPMEFFVDYPDRPKYKVHSVTEFDADDPALDLACTECRRRRDAKR